MSTLLVLIELIDWRYSQSCWYFRPALWTSAPLTFSLVHSPPSLCEIHVHFFCTYTVCNGVGVKGHRMGGGHKADKMPAAKITTFGIAFYQSNLSTWYGMEMVIRQSNHRVHRVATAAFWRTFSHDEGKISPGWWGWGVHAHPLSLHLPSPVKLQCTLQLSGQTH